MEGEETPNWSIINWQVSVICFEFVWSDLRLVYAIGCSDKWPDSPAETRPNIFSVFH